MPTFYFSETDNINSQRTLESFKSQTIKSAKIKATNLQHFQSTCIKLYNASKQLIAYKQGGKWYDTYFIEQ